MLSAIGRAAIRRLGTQPANRLVQTFPSASRVTTFKSCTVPFRYAQFATSTVRFYAPAAASKTKKATKKSTTTKSKATTSKKSGTKKATKKATTKKTKKTATKAKKPARKKLTEKQKEERDAKKGREHIRELKETALLSDEPKRLPDTTWMLVFAEHMKANAGKGKGRIDGTVAKGASEKYKSLAPEELEQYNHQANQNKTANANAFKKWVASYTPDEIRLANNARKLLTKKTGKTYSSIPDERAPKRPRSAYFIFTADRWATGDMKGIPITRTATIIREEWDKLSASEKKAYEDKAVADKERYAREFKSAFH